MSIFRALLISAAVLTMTPSATFAQVRIITPDSEHIYGQGGQLLDDAELRARNERAERAKSLRLREREIAMRQQELDAAAAARAAPTAYYEPYGAQDGSYYIGTFRSCRVDTSTCGGLARAPFRATRYNSDMRMREYVADKKNPPVCMTRWAAPRHISSKSRRKIAFL